MWPRDHRLNMLASKHTCPYLFPSPFPDKHSSIKLNSLLSLWLQKSIWLWLGKGTPLLASPLNTEEHRSQQGAPTRAPLPPQAVPRGLVLPLFSLKTTSNLKSPFFKSFASTLILLHFQLKAVLLISVRKTPRGPNRPCCFLEWVDFPACTDHLTHIHNHSLTLWPILLKLIFESS